MEFNVEPMELGPWFEALVHCPLVCMARLLHDSDVRWLIISFCCLASFSNLCQHTMISSRASLVFVMRKAKQEPNEKARFEQYLRWFEQRWLIVVYSLGNKADGNCVDWV